MTDEDDPASAYGVEFGPLKPALREHAYPVTRSELIEQYGGFELDHAGGSDHLETVLRESDTPTFREPRQVRDAILAELDPDALTARSDSADDESDESDETGDWSPTSV